jgi:AraC-like DNA-binding protein/quercetin dioxygenase-like cupin family protein
LPARPLQFQAVTTAAADHADLRPDAERPLRVRSRRLAADTRIEPHQHPWAQLAYSATGVLRVTAGQHTYIVPPSRAVWIPPGVEHVVTVVEDAELRTLYLHLAPGQCGPAALGVGSTPGTAPAWQQCRVLEVSPLMREAVEQLSALPPSRPPGAAAARATAAREHCLAMLVQDELHRARPVALGVGLPSDKRLRALCEAVLNDPARHATLQGWAFEAGASVRTVGRLFRQELGTTFAEWRQQVLLAKALSMAAHKRPMAHIAAELGYASASAFSAMVRRSVGVPPSRFFAAA